MAGSPGGKGSLPFIHECKGGFGRKQSCLSLAGLRAVGGRTDSDKSLPSPAASQCVLARARAWGVMKWDRQDGWGSGSLQSLVKSFWSPDSYSPWGLRPLWESAEGCAACLSNFVHTIWGVYELSSTFTHWLQVQSSLFVVSVNQAAIYMLLPTLHTHTHNTHTYTMQMHINGVQHNNTGSFGSADKVYLQSWAYQQSSWWTSSSENLKKKGSFLAISAATCLQGCNAVWSPGVLGGHQEESWGTVQRGGCQQGPWSLFKYEAPKLVVPAKSTWDGKGSHWPS